MIINVRGANGSGKSTLVKRILDLYESEAFYVSRRQRPMGYRCKSFRNGANVLLIPGAYETPTGGCDTISDASTIYDMIQQAAEAGLDVLFEGIVAQHNTTRLLEIMRSHAVVVIQLTTSMEDCIESVRARRIARGETAPFAGENVKKEWKSVVSSCDRIRSNGYTVLKLDREAAFREICTMLEIPAEQIEVAS
jgi:hypothetical protein